MNDPAAKAVREIQNAFHPSVETPLILALLSSLKKKNNAGNSKRIPSY